MEIGYFNGKCSMCGNVKNIRFKNLYVTGSEGINICIACEIQILDFVRHLMREASENKKARFKAVKLIEKLKEQVEERPKDGFVENYNDKGDEHLSMVHDIVSWSFEITANFSIRSRIEKDLYKCGMEIAKAVHSIWLTDKSPKTFEDIFKILLKATCKK